MDLILQEVDQDYFVLNDEVGRQELEELAQELAQKLAQKLAQELLVFGIFVCLESGLLEDDVAPRLSQDL